MSAASYIGRVGGLAVALGVGSAVFTGAGIAHATEGEDPGSGTPAGQEESSGTSTNTTTTTNGTETGDPGTIDFKLPRLSDVIGRHRADSSTPNSLTATSIVKRLSEAAKRVTDAIENATDADNTVVRSTTRRNGSGSSLSERLSERAESAGAEASPPRKPEDAGAAGTTTVVSNQFANRAAVAKDWIASPSAVAGRSVDTTPTTPAITPLWTPPRIIAPFGTMQATPGTGSTAVRTTSPLTVVLGGLNPFAGNTPGAPTSVNPLGLIVAGAARREIGVDSYTPTALLAPTTNSLIYAPTPTFLHGVIGGTNTPESGVMYLVVSQPSGGGKVTVDPTTGSYSFLPDLATVTSNGSETFRVVAAETTPFTQALTSIPVIGDLVDDVLIVLYQLPVVNVVLSPIIGRSKITSITVDLTDVPDYQQGDPVAFTVMVPSDDGVMISTNYFPAWSVADGSATEAPTILNGPGLATAGNVDPSAPSTVDGLVPGISALTSAGYNVVTWDPRGEFNSTGRLELDSPEFEGQDVKNIISWIVDNRAYTYADMESEATGDPWVGMVGGSYGGGIQWASSSVDPRIDVITPGISWNTLTGSLYTNEAFKTSYSSLLLLDLVLNGARINPEIYAGIITGGIFGILTPSQQALLNRSGPGGPDAYIGDIIVPAMLIQGTVDVLFPLQQSILNTQGLGTPAEDVKMIWYCGGHGVCLTMNDAQLAQQEAFLRQTTIAWLDTYLPEADGSPDSVVGPIPKFQYVDQNGDLWQSDVLPDDFTGAALIGVSDPAATGGLLAIVPVLGGSGPQTLVPLPYSLGLGAPASNAINVPITPTLTEDTTNVVGSPHLTFDYSGVGTSRHVYAQIVDKNTGLVVGNIVTPVDVTLDGTQRQAVVDMEAIAWTYTDAYGTPTHPNNYNDLELQITSSATAYENFTSYGFIEISNVQVTLPTAGAGQVTAGDWTPDYDAISA